MHLGLTIKQNNKMCHVVMSLLMQILLSAHNTNVCKQILENKDRGHLCASADRLYSREVNEQTFYYTNMSPQRNKFNTGIWLTLEGQVQSWGRSCTSSDTLYVVKGGTIDKEDQIRGYISNDRSKPIPRYYYMALLFKKGDSFKAIAFWMEHTDSPKSTKLVDYALSIDELEEKTGIDFFPSLNDNLENALEATYSTKAWPGLE